MNRRSDRRIDQVLSFWFEELGPEQWFKKDDTLDRTIAERFQDLHSELAAGVPEAWRQNAKGCFAAILVLDQFSRNLYRDDPRAFACDESACGLANEAIERGWDQQIDLDRRTFFYLPFTHAENPVEQARSVELHTSVGENLLDWAVQHKDIIDRFGRFPHRNAVLGRISTEQELAFLKQPNSSF